MATLPDKNLLDGSKSPATKVSEMKTAMGQLRDYLAGLLGTDGTAATARAALSAAIKGANSDITSLNALNDPLFSAFLSTTQTIATATNVTLLPNSKEFDTANCYDPLTGRYTPNRAGYYLFEAQCRFVTNATGVCQLTLGKNLTGVAVSFLNNSTSAGFLPVLRVSKILVMNGTTDYASIIATQTSGANMALPAGVDGTYFQGTFLRNA